MTCRDRCEKHGKDIYRSFGAAMSAASNCTYKRDVVLRAYYDSSCCSYHISSHFYFEAASA